MGKILPVCCVALGQNRDFRIAEVVNVASDGLQSFTVGRDGGLKGLVMLGSLRDPTGIDGCGGSRNDLKPYVGEVAVRLTPLVQDKA